MDNQNGIDSNIDREERRVDRDSQLRASKLGINYEITNISMLKGNADVSQHQRAPVGLTKYRKGNYNAQGAR